MIKKYKIHVHYINSNLLEDFYRNINFKSEKEAIMFIDKNKKDFDLIKKKTNINILVLPIYDYMGESNINVKLKIINYIKGLF